MEQWEVLAVDTNAVMRFKTENREIPGIRLLLCDYEPAKGNKPRYLGFAWHDQFISNERLGRLGEAPRPGDIIQLLFNRYGDIIELKVVSGG